MFAFLYFAPFFCCRTWLSLCSTIDCYRSPIFQWTHVRCRARAQSYWFNMKEHLLSQLDAFLCRNILKYLIHFISSHALGREGDYPTKILFKIELKQHTEFIFPVKTFGFTTVFRTLEFLEMFPQFCYTLRLRFYPLWHRYSRKGIEPGSAGALSTAEKERVQQLMSCRSMVSWSAIMQLHRPSFSFHLAPSDADAVSIGWSGS